MTQESAGGGYARGYRYEVRRRQGAGAVLETVDRRALSVARAPGEASVEKQAGVCEAIMVWGVTAAEPGGSRRGVEVRWPGRLWLC